MHLSERQKNLILAALCFAFDEGRASTDSKDYWHRRLCLTNVASFAIEGRPYPDVPLETTLLAAIHDTLFRLVKDD